MGKPYAYLTPINGATATSSPHPGHPTVFVQLTMKPITQNYVG